jgi:hypothetical protein
MSIQSTTNANSAHDIRLASEVELSSLFVIKLTMNHLMRSLGLPVNAPSLMSVSWGQ